MKRLLDQRKLTLVLDLDHTILNSVNQDHLTPQEWDQLKAAQAQEHRECPQQAHNCDGLLWHIPHIGMWTKLRPRVREFLRQVSAHCLVTLCDCCIVAGTQLKLRAPEMCKL